MKATERHDVSAILLNWKRPWNIPLIVESLAQYDFIREVIVWDNSGILHADEVAPQSCRLSIRVLSQLENVGTYGRFLAAEKAGCPLVYTQDDDHIVHNVDEIYQRHCRFPDSITAALSDTPTARHYACEAGKKPWIQLGWGSMFNREAIGVLGEWIARHGEDDLLKSKADRIFTVIHDRHVPLLADYTPLKNPDGILSERDANSLWLQSDHYKLRDEAVARALLIRGDE